MDTSIPDPVTTAADAPPPLELVAMGDIHVYRLWTWPWHLLSKRLLGQANLWLNRRGRFDLDMLPAMVEQIDRLDPDVIVHTGDLTTTALHSEFRFAADRLQPLLVDWPTYLVPGNHDRYTFTAHRERHFEEHFPEHAFQNYPWHREIAPGVHLIGLDATRANKWNASGRLGENQRQALADLLGQLQPPLRQVVVMCHYPIGTPPGFAKELPGHRMNDLADLTRTLADSGLPIVYLHGHVHQPWCWRHPDAANVLVINCGAPVMRDPLHPVGQGFWQITIGPTGELELARHVADPSGRWRQTAITPPTDPDQTADVA